MFNSSNDQKKPSSLIIVNILIPCATLKLNERRGSASAVHIDIDLHTQPLVLTHDGAGDMVSPLMFCCDLGQRACVV